MSTAPSAPSTTPPPAEARRILDIDALRSFALFGILVVNIDYFASGYPFHQVHDPAFSSAVDGAARWTTAVFFEMKFSLLFSFLFGYSFTLQVDSARRRGADFRPRFLRRLAALLVIGLLHAVLLFQGDILSTYALLGLLLLAVHRIRPRTALVAAGVITALVAVQFLAMAATGVADVDTGTAEAAGARTADALAGGPLDLVAEHVRSLPHMAIALVGMQGPVAFAAFLAGLAAGRYRVLADPGAHQRALRLLPWVGFPVGLAGSVFFAGVGGTASAAGVAVAVLTAPLLAGAYAATLLRFFRTGAGGRVAAAVAPAGRTALTNYLLQSLVCVLLFTGVGLGLVGSVPPAATLLIAAGICLLQVGASAWWTARHPYGPVEWVLRAVTNAEVPRWSRSGAHRR
ncbi:DUF418 domain-containing protein [Nocardiopsis halophila]|uniref:DUF418 domain-containing protein n=1 Tax=Nocardiopsis halophila TaxID=141692 RepID=UPI0003454ABF|nr:DUF418 domain-containing protein [Nocardiopsis halophila]